MEQVQDLAKTFVKRINDGVTEFGRYHYFDKGAREVVDIDACLYDLKPLDIHVVGEVLEAVLRMIPEYGVEFVNAILLQLQYMDDAEWEKLMSHKDVESCYY